MWLAESQHRSASAQVQAWPWQLFYFQLPLGSDSYKPARPSSHSRWVDLSGSLQPALQWGCLFSRLLVLQFCREHRAVCVVAGSCFLTRACGVNFYLLRDRYQLVSCPFLTRDCPNLTFYLIPSFFWSLGLFLVLRPSRGPFVASANVLCLYSFKKHLCKSYWVR